MATPTLALRSVSKRFDMTAALTDMSLELYPGEVHALVGENGAGKSTIIKIMTGVYQPTSGQIEIDGEPVVLHGSKAARQHGIAAIYQEPMVFPDLDVAENIFISSIGGGLFLRRAAQRRQAMALIARIGITLDVDRMAAGLTLAEQQAVEIARALCQDVHVLIMDEPTASLSAHEAQELRRIARELAAAGVCVVYISHRLEEVFEIADRVSVIRDGRHISTRAIAEATPETMIAEMVGREVGNYFAKAPSHAQDEVLLSVRGLSVGGIYRDIDFDIRKGEILCMAGLVGARRTDVALTVFGLLAASSGSMTLAGLPYAPKSARDAIAAGVAYVSEDRRKYGLAVALPVRWNVTIATLERFLSRFGLIDVARERSVTRDYRTRLNIRVDDLDAPVLSLSGGTQQ